MKKASFWVGHGFSQMFLSVVSRAGAAQNLPLEMKSLATFFFLNLEQVLRTQQPPLNLWGNFPDI